MDMNTRADRMIKDGEINPMIIACSRIENSRGMNLSLICKKCVCKEYLLRTDKEFEVCPVEVAKRNY